MVGEAKSREIPWCSICLVIAAITCHSLVLLGNLNTSAMFNKIGHSTTGWSHIGQQLGSSLENELDTLMQNVSTRLTSVINTTMSLKTGVDEALSLIGNTTDTEMAGIEIKANHIAYLQMIREASAHRFARPKASWKSDAILAKGDAHHDRPRALPEEAGSDEVWMMETSRVKMPRSPELLNVSGMFKDEDWEKLAHDINPFHISVADMKTPLKNLTIPSDLQSIETDLEIVEWATQNPDKVMEDLTRLANNNSAKAKEIFRKASKEATEMAIAKITSVIDSAMGLVSNMTDEFLVMIKPALLQIGKWLKSFGTKVQTIIEGFSNTLDKVQKIFDQIMAKMAHSKGLDLMVHDTYNLFDASHTGSISVSDLQDVGQVYGITALSGDKAKELLLKYDADGNGALETSEFELFVQDPSIPGAMAVVLRAYSKKLAQIAGQVARARKRDEVAQAVVLYLSLVCAKNMTKVGWVSTTLTNGSLPMAFTADVLKNLAEQDDNPDRLYSTDPGPIIVSKMLELNHDYVMQVLSLMSEPTFWQSEGFDPDDQSRYVQRVTGWVTNASKTALLDIDHGKVQTHLYSLFGGEAGEQHSVNGGGRARVDLLMLEAMPRMAAGHVEEQCRRHSAKKRAHRKTRHARLVSSRTATILFDELFSGTTAGSTTEDPVATAAINSGVPAVPATLEFAKFLSYNASDTASRFQHQCFDFMGDSSSQLDSFATQIQTMTKKITSFLNQMMQYSTPSGIDKLETEMKDFASKATDNVKKVVLEKVYMASDKLSEEIEAISLVEQHQALITNTEDPSEAFMKVKSTLDELQTVLPQVVANLKFAKKEVAAVSKQLPSVFDSMEQKGPPIFQTVADLYKTMWTAYFVLFATITVGVLFYAFWASGWFGGRNVKEEAPEEGFQPATFRDRMRTVCSACCQCMSDWHDNLTCFWSCIIFSEVIVLLMFIVAIILSLLSGVKAFLGSGCAEIYFLADNSVCQGVLDVVKGWLETFWEGAGTAFPDVCQSESLLTCHLIEEELMKSVLYTTFGSIVAAALTFQMILDTAQLHEQVLWRHKYDELYNTK